MDIVEGGRFGRTGRRLRQVGLFGIAVSLFLLCAAGHPAAREIHVDPAVEAGGSGAPAHPYQTIHDAIDAAGNGGRLLLRPGYYGALNLRNITGLVLEPSAGQAVFSSITLDAVTDVTLRSLTVRWDKNPPEPPGETVGAYKNVAVRVDHSDNVTIEDLSISSTEDGTEWTADDWRRRAATGISANGTRMVIRGNRLSFVRHAISLSGDNGVIDGNTVAHFSGDGIRAIGNDNIVQDNLVHSCYGVDANHDDGFQSWSIGPDGRAGTGITRGTVLRRNKFFSYLKPGHPLQCRMQGIGLFDGIYEDWLIENNLVVVDHWHGISVYGAKNVIIRNNTIYDPVDNDFGPAGIGIVPHKDGRTPVASAIVNNLAPRQRHGVGSSFSVTRDGVEYRGNVYYGNPKNVFRDPGAHDFRPPATSFGMDRASGETPTVDIEGLPRPWGKRADVGAYEYRGE